MEAMKKQFETELDKLLESGNSEKHNVMSKLRYISVLNEVKLGISSKAEKKPLTTKLYRRLKRFDIITIGNSEKLIKKQSSGSQEAIVYYVPSDEIFDILHAAHLSTGHKRQKGMVEELRKKYANITKEVIDIYLKLCETYQLKKKNYGKGLVVKPIISNHMNSRCQVDLIDMQSEADGEFKFILNYQDHLTKYCVLRPLKAKTAEETALHLIDIFCLFGAPHILQSDNGREFANSVINSLSEKWPQLKIVHGKPRHSQSQGSVERCNQDVRDALICWMTDQNSRNWADGLRFVQANKNRSYHKGIRRSPYEAMFGTPQRIGLKDSDLPQEVIDNLISEDDLQKVVIQTQPDVNEVNLNDLDNMDEIDINENINPIKLSSSYDTDDVIDQFPIESNNEQFSCIICNGPVLIVKQCMICKEILHETCGIIQVESEVIEFKCFLCQRKENIGDNRLQSKRSLEVQAETMLLTSNKKFKPAEIGDNVIVRVPDVDRGRTAPRNIMAIVMDVTDEGFYKLGTKTGILKRLYARNEFQNSESKFMTMCDVKDAEISIRSASGQTSGSSQGFIACACKKNCRTKMCTCLKKKLLF